MPSLPLPRRLSALAVAVASLAGVAVGLPYAPAAEANAPTTCTVNSGGTLYASSTADGGVQLRDSSSGKLWYSDRDYTKVFLNGTALQAGGNSNSAVGGASWNTISNTQIDPYTCDTRVDIIPGAVSLLRRIHIGPGSRALEVSWTLSNTSSTSYSDVRLITGADAFFSGSDTGYSGVVNTVNGPMPYIWKDSGSGSFSMVGAEGYPISRYFAGNYSTGYNQMNSGTLSNSVDPGVVDNGLFAQWNTASLPAGTSWTVKSTQGVSTSGTVQVTPPSPQTFNANGQGKTYSFTLVNVTGSPITVTPTASCTNGWTCSYGGGAVTVPANGSSTVAVTHTSPATGTSSSSVLSLTVGTALGNVTSTLATPELVSVTVGGVTYQQVQGTVNWKNLDGAAATTLLLLDANKNPIPGVVQTGTITSGNYLTFTIDSSLPKPATYYVRAQVTGIPGYVDSAPFVIPAAPEALTSTQFLRRSGPTTLVGRTYYVANSSPRAVTLELLNASQQATGYSGTASVASGGEVSIPIPRTLAAGTYYLRSTVASIGGSVLSPAFTLSSYNPSITATSLALLNPSTNAVVAKVAKGDAVKVTGTLTNNGNVDLTSCTIAVPQDATSASVASSLAAGASTPISFATTVGSVTSNPRSYQVKVQCLDPADGNAPVTFTANLSVAAKMPAVSIVGVTAVNKGTGATIPSGGTIPAGATVTFTYTVKNTGEIPLPALALTTASSFGGEANVACTPTPLAPSATATCTFDKKF